MPQQLLIAGTVLFLLSLLVAFAIPVLANPRMGVAVHVAGLQSGMTLWAMGLMWQHLVLSEVAQRTAQFTATAGLYAIFASILLAAVWGASRALPIAGAGHQASRLREMAVTALIAGGSVAITVAVLIVLWGLCASKP
ncbi:hydroxylaminobenzene mutase [Dyella japonica DSM 16301]|uniref:Hydroxylaminobenzene mutase n=1 Tax=Dyella japonica DSM 16301 TaxID=1440762 RepID=A0A0G9H9N4_9GAMM|nr:hydroxylaminobenzene mutase [Dyella japonica DSM 16301]